MTTAKDDEVPVVLKFGGSSVADADRLRQVAEIIDRRAANRPVVVVVSAMGDTTDRLVLRARELLDAPPARELDMLLTTGERTSMAMLAIALHARGRSAISLTGSQCGIITNHRHGRARVVEVRPFRISDELAAGHAVIVGGFAGVSYKREVTTLGRGGSDTTAVALAAALGADCEIYSDVDGIYSADPRGVPEPKRLDEVSFQAMRAMSRAGAKVLHAEAVRLAESAGVRLYARSSTGGSGQTLVHADAEEAMVTAVACDPGVRRVVAIGRTEATAAELMRVLAEFSVRDIHVVRDEGRPRAEGLLSTSQDPSPEDTARRLRAALDPIANDIVVSDPCGLVSVIGAGLEARPEVTNAALDALAAEGIDVLAGFSDTHTLAWLVAPAATRATQRALHRALIDTPRSSPADTV